MIKSEVPIELDVSVSGQHKYKAEIRWSAPPPSAQAVVTGYLLTLYDNVDLANPAGAKCGCEFVPACQTSKLLSHPYHRGQVVSLEKECLPLQSMQTQYIGFKLTALPLPSNRSLPASSIEGKIRIGACHEYDWRKLSDLCKVIVAYRPPRLSSDIVKYTLANHTIHVSWTKPETNLTITHYTLKAKPVKQKPGNYSLNLILPRNTTGHEITGLTAGLKYVITVGVYTKLNVSAIPNINGILARAHGVSVLAAHNLLVLLKFTLDSGFELYEFVVTMGEDGKWDTWTAWSTECSCDSKKNQTRWRKCHEPKPGSGGMSCFGQSTEERVCSSFQLKGDCSATYPEAESKVWYEQPVFYITTSTAVLVLILLVFIVSRIVHRRNKQGRVGYTLLTEQQADGTDCIATTQSPGTVVVIDGEKTIFLETDITLPDIHLVLSFGDNSLWNNTSEITVPAIMAQTAPTLHDAVKSTTVYISYARFSDIHNSNVLAFSAWLTHFGLRVVLDQYDTIGLGSDLVGWTERSLMSADKVVVILSNEYYFDWYSMESRSQDEDRCPDRQACLEAKLIQALIMEGRCTNRVCVPVYLGPVYQRACLPAMLDNSISFRLLEDDIVTARKFLYYLCGVQEHQRPDLDEEVG